MQIYHNINNRNFNVDLIFVFVRLVRNLWSLRGARAPWPGRASARWTGSWSRRPPAAWSRTRSGRRSGRKAGREWGWAPAGPALPRAPRPTACMPGTPSIRSLYTLILNLASVVFVVWVWELANEPQFLPCDQLSQQTISTSLFTGTKQNSGYFVQLKISTW